MNPAEHPESSDVIVIGAGVVGVCTAWALASRGISVRVLERGEICSGASHGNAGWIFPDHSMPIPAPGVIRQSFRWLLDPDSPLYIRPRLDPELIRWLWEFRGACSEAKMRRSYQLRRELSIASLDLYAKLAADLEFGFKELGLLLAFNTAEALEHGQHELGLLNELGGSGTVLDAAATRECVPALDGDLVGGILLERNAHITPGRFVHGLAEQSRRLGARFESNTEVLEIEREGTGVLLRTTQGVHRSKHVVVASGAWSGQLTALLGLRIPLQGAKGYSITVERPESFGELPVMLSEAKVGVTPMDSTLRFAGTLELAGLDLDVNMRRVRAIERAARTFLPGLPETRIVELWRGLRPMTPDDLPLIGTAPALPELIVATGHGMKGISQGPITGELVAQLICGEKPEIDLTPFSPARFG